jgi:hypothetical protein
MGKVVSGKWIGGMWNGGMGRLAKRNLGVRLYTLVMM